MPCDEEQGQVNVESAACCATSSVAPAAIKAVGEQAPSDAGLTFTIHAPWTTLHSFEVADLGGHQQCQFDPPDIPTDLSLTYLQTGRLRL